MASVAMGYHGGAVQRMMMTAEMRQMAEQRRYQEMQQQQQQQQESSAMPGQFRMPATPANPAMMTYHRQSHPCMVNPAMRMGGCQGETLEWAGCRVPTCSNMPSDASPGRPSRNGQSPGGGAYS